MNQAIETELESSQSLSGVRVKASAPVAQATAHRVDAYATDDAVTLRADQFPIIVDRQRAYMICAAFFLSGGAFTLAVMAALQ